MTEPTLIYWDADVFLSFLNVTPNRILIVDAILDRVRKNNNETIVTSTISKVEVAYITQEKINRAISQEEETRIDNLWNDNSIVEMIEFTDDISLIARDFIRQGINRGGGRLKPMDAIHIASAVWIGSIEFNTYNLNDYRAYENLVDFQIRKPFVNQSRLL